MLEGSQSNVLAILVAEIPKVVIKELFTACWASIRDHNLSVGQLL